MKPATVKDEIRILVEKAGSRPMTAEARERQIVSLAFGNVKLENDRVTKASVADIARRTRSR